MQVLQCNAATKTKTRVEVPDVEPGPPLPYELRKDDIFARLLKIGKGVAFATLLKQDLIAERWWSDSPCVMSDNPTWLQYKEAFIPLLSMTQEEVDYVGKEGRDV